jgi:Kef-type K+ transport system membrane component KefB
MLPFILPVEIICVLFLVFWLVPLISKKTKIPSIILYIIFGIIIGPYGFHIIDNDARIKLLSDIGIMFIMFLAGLELNPTQIKSNKKNSIVFGALILVVPISVGFTIFHFLLHYEITTSILISLMFSTQTLVSYPIASRLGLTSKRSVITAVGGTIISDSVVLFAIGLVVTSTKGEIDSAYLLKFLSLIVGFILVVIFGFPFIIKRFFDRYEETAYSSFSLVIFFLFLAGTLAHFVGLEAIIGAFLTGIILNKYIPKNSSLLSNLHFVGNGIFIPIFLFYVGMLIDYQAVISDTETLIIAGMLTVIALTAKLFASFVAGKIFRFSYNEIGLLFGLTSSHAAVVIATALIGYNIGIISVHILNATVFLILISCVSSTFVTENFGRKVVLDEPQIEFDEDNNERIIVPYSNPNTIDGLLAIAVNMSYPNPNNIIYPLTIVMENNKQYKETIAINKKKITEITQNKYSKEISFSPVSRIDINPTTGIDRALKELMGTMLIIGWTGNIHRGDILGKNIDIILGHNDIQTVVCHINKPLTYFKNIVVGVPDNANFEKGFSKWMHHIYNLSINTSLTITFIGSDLMIKNIQKYCDNNLKQLKPNYVPKNTQELKLDYINHLEKTSLLVTLFARDKSISHEIHSENIIKALKNKENDLNFIVIVPEQYSMGDKTDADSFENDFSELIKIYNFR